MTAFDDLQRSWDQQTMLKTAPRPEELVKRAEKNTQQIKAKHWWNISILSLFVIFLIWFFGYAAGFRLSQASAGFLLMILSILLRVVLEYASYAGFSKIEISKSFKEYTEQVTKFYLRRKKIHYLLTPAILLVYITGFILLLPVFRQHLSAGFYTYIIISGTVFFIVFAWFIIKQIKKEMGLLFFLKNIQ